ncbi:MAG TPA: hypothetical protein VF629_03915 [Hymenobacter sp.]|jgi:hypothetical protein|uniref:hypothetical protein n=1 Tax=Hymenobacter sp. TaxID=1898978 RepID=UPI002ED7B58F
MLLSYLLSLLAFAGPPQAPRDPVPTLPAAIRRALPAGYAVLDAAQGDLNRDARPDWLVVLNKPNEAKTSDVGDHPTKRPLLLFVGGAGGTYALAVRTDNAVYCVDCGGMMGDPFMGLAIKQGYFTVEHYGGSAERWTRYVTFRYDPTARTWLLHRDGRERFHVLNPEQGTTTATTAKEFGRVPLATFDIYKR